MKLIICFCFFIYISTNLYSQSICFKVIEIDSTSFRYDNLYKISDLESDDFKNLLVNKQCESNITLIKSLNISEVCLSLEERISVYFEDENGEKIRRLRPRIILRDNVIIDVLKEVYPLTPSECLFENNDSEVDTYEIINFE